MAAGILPVFEVLDKTKLVPHDESRMSFVCWQYALFLPAIVVLYWQLPWRGRIFLLTGAHEHDDGRGGFYLDDGWLDDLASRCLATVFVFCPGKKFCRS